MAKIVAMLLSDSDAELLAAVRAIRATLGGAGCDLHDLAAHIENGASAFPIMREPFRWPDPPSPSPTAAERAEAEETMRRSAEAWAEEAAKRKAEKAAKRAETLAKNMGEKARCEGKGGRAPTWEMLLRQPNRIALILKWLDQFLELDITADERERAVDLRTAVRFDRLGLEPDGVRRFNGWLVRTYNRRRNAEFSEVA